MTFDADEVRSILERAGDHPWRMQGIGLLSLALDERREWRLHAWDPDACVGDPPVHDHPYDFTSTVIAGEITDTRWVGDPSGAPFRRERYSPPDEDRRRADTVRLVGSSSTYRAGDRYSVLAPELHDSRQLPGTVTLVRCTWHDRPELTVCLPPGAPWISARARPATPAEIARLTGAALDRLRASPTAR